MCDFWKDLGRLESVDSKKIMIEMTLTFFIVYMNHVTYIIDIPRRCLCSSQFIADLF